MNCPRISVLLFVLAWAGATGPATAQISSPAFDPNCYQPRIGVPGEIDTIYGGYVGQELGAGLINIGPAPDNPGGAGMLMFGGLAGDKAISGRGGAYSAVDCGPNFDPHHMTFSSFKGLILTFNFGGSYTLGHFHSRKYNDILIYDDSFGRFDRIFWADEQGNYDSGRYTTLKFKRNGIQGGTSILPCHGHFTSDIVEDVISRFGVRISDANDSQFYLLFQGGNALYKPNMVVEPNEVVFSDSSHAFDGQYPGNNLKYYTADFRGVGKSDCVMADNRGNLFFYKNNPPFNIAEFTRAMSEDTLLLVDGDRRVASSYRGYGAIAMRALPKPPGDSSFDLVLPLDSNTQSSLGGQFRIFRGGPDFGSHRLTIDSAYTLHDPTCFDSNTFRYTGWGNPFNAGDLTGTGRPVLGIGGEDQNSFVGLAAFYVLGDQIDDKVDMFFSGYLMGGIIDTCTIDGDGLQDLANGDPGYNVDGNLSGEDIGTVRFFHGSKKIPVPNRAVKRSTPVSTSFSVERTADGRSLLLQIPTGASLCEARLYDILGRAVLISTIPVTAESTATLALPLLPRGTYVLEVRSGQQVFQAKLIL